MLYIGCVPPSASVRTVALEMGCRPPSEYGAIPNDGIDDRAALQLALDSCAGTRVTLALGRYLVDTPLAPRVAPYAMLVMPPNTALVGAGDETVLGFRGDPQQQDWRGIEVANGVLIDGLSLVTELCPGCTNEQTHLVHGGGVASITDVEIGHVTFNHPVRPGSSSGDCIQFPGYANKPNSNIRIHDNRFLACSRSCFAWHSGLRFASFMRNVAIDPSDQCLDGEGDDPGANLVEDFEIGGNTFLDGPNAAGPWSIQLVDGVRVHMHNNTFIGRGPQIAGGSAIELDNNTVLRTFPGPDPAVLVFKGAAGVVMHDERYARAAIAGPGAVLSIEQRISYPVGVSLVNSEIVQHAPFHPVTVKGGTSVTFQGVQMIYDGSALGTQVGIYFAGTRRSATTIGVHATDLHVLDTVISGPLKAAVNPSGIYFAADGTGGVGTLDVQRVTSIGTTRGLWCETTGGIAGPVTYATNTMPPPMCGALTPAP